MTQVRVQILLKPRQHTALKNAARREDKSVSELLREITDEYLSRHISTQEDEVFQTLDSLKQIRERQSAYRGDPVAEARRDRDGQQGGV